MCLAWELDGEVRPHTLYRICLQWSEELRKKRRK